MKQYFKRFQQSAYYLPVLVGIVTLVVVIVGVGLALQNSDAEKITSQSDGSGKGTSLRGNISDLIGSTKSTSNLVGLTLRVNQIDVCRLPELSAYVAVASEAGDVSKLSDKDIEVRIDGEKINNPRFEKIDASEQPLSATMVIDRSGSMAGAPIEYAREAANTFVDRSSSNDSLGVISFDHQVNVVRQPTSDLEKVKKDIAGIGVRGDTALYDAIGRAVEVTDGCSRRAIVVLSDGGDTASSNFSLSEAINSANVEGVPLFVVGLRGTTYDESTLSKIAEGTGGQLFQTDSPSELTDLYKRIDDQLKGQYQVRIQLDLPKTGKEHRLEIKSVIDGSPTVSERSFIY